MKKVMIITFYFPPRPEVGSLRPYGLVKYLPYFGWEPIVLTARLPNNNFNNVRIIETYYPGNVTDLLKSKVGLKKEAAFRE